MKQGFLVQAEGGRWVVREGFSEDSEHRLEHLCVSTNATIISPGLW